MSAPAQVQRPADLANQLFTTVLAQSKNDVKETKKVCINFLLEALMHTIVQTSSDAAERTAVLKSVGEVFIAAAAPPPSKP